MDQLHQLRALVERHSKEGQTESAIPRLTFYIESDPTVVTYVVYQPVFCLILGGVKRTVLGGHVFEIAAGDYLAVSVDLPATGQVLESPYVALTLTLDLATVADLITDMPEPISDRSEVVEVNRVGSEILDPILRLVRLLEAPRDLRVLAPLFEREVLWRILHTPSGPAVRQIALATSRLSQVNRAIRWLRTNYAEPVRIERLAAMAGMSPASFHRHFKVITAMTPLQYQKQIRLQTARARLIAQSGDVGGIGFSVGYDSPSQFSREYARMFGTSPGRDAAHFRDAPRQ
jgi:AraC-like DNA-binding protein